MLQTILCVIVFHLGQTSESFPDTVVDSMDRWKSLASDEDQRAVCGLDLAMSSNFVQFQIMATVDGYFAKMFDVQCGPALVRVVILLWFATLVNLVRDLYDMGTAVLLLTDWKSTGVKLTQGTKSCIVHRVPPKRCAWMMLVTLIQLLVIGVLTISGTWFLVHTTELSDLLLNSVALGFVTDTDELLFQALVPSIVKGLVSHTEPLRLLPRGRLPPLRSLHVRCGDCRSGGPLHFHHRCD